ncbi:MAG: hypothetical protein WA081_05440 [Desulfosalsimonadaceae bacterium]
MAQIFQFPSKKDFFKSLPPNVPPDLIDCLQKEYDAVLAQRENCPILVLKTDMSVSEQIEKIETFKNEFSQFNIKLLSEILELRAEICLLKNQL